MDTGQKIKKYKIALQKQRNHLEMNNKSEHKITLPEYSTSNGFIRGKKEAIKDAGRWQITETLIFKESCCDDFDHEIRSLKKAFDSKLKAQIMVDNIIYYVTNYRIRTESDGQRAFWFRLLSA